MFTGDILKKRTIRHETDTFILIKRISRNYALVDVYLFSDDITGDRLLRNRKLSIQLLHKQFKEVDPVSPERDLAVGFFHLPV